MCCFTRQQIEQHPAALGAVKGKRPIIMARLDPAIHVWRSRTIAALLTDNLSAAYGLVSSRCLLPLRLGQEPHTAPLIATRMSAANAPVGGCDGISLRRGKMISLVLNGSSL